MDKQDNPFFNFLEVIRNQQNNSDNYMIGKVTSTNPLAVETGGIQLSREDLLINKDLLKGTKRDVKINGTLITESSFNMYKGEIENIEDCFVIGDNVVLLMSQDQQQFILLCVVV